MAPDSIQLAQDLLANPTRLCSSAVANPSDVMSEPRYVNLVTGSTV